MREEGPLTLCVCVGVLALGVQQAPFEKEFESGGVGFLCKSDNTGKLTTKVRVEIKGRDN